MKPIAVLTPYSIPRDLAARKVVNIGDGFILRGIERLLGPFNPKMLISPRITPSASAATAMEDAQAVILAGANQLNDRYTVWPGMTSAQLQARRWRFVPFGIGIHGKPGFNERMSDETRLILEIIHQRIEFSSWRCPRTVQYLERELPYLKGRFLMTSCPVLYDRPLLESSRFDESESSVAVTATERHDFWDRETTIIDAVVRRYPRAQRYFVVHQNFSPPSLLESLRQRLPDSSPDSLTNRVEALRLYAVRLGFKVVIPPDADACMRFYQSVDVHVGSRLHAHLFFLSRNKRSFLVPVDKRSHGIAEHLGFPLPTPDQLDANWDFDFERVRENARGSYEVMTRFVRSLPS